MRLNPDVIQTQRLRIAAGLPLAEALMVQMAAFRASVTVVGGDAGAGYRRRARHPQRFANGRERVASDFSEMGNIRS